MRTTSAGATWRRRVASGAVAILFLLPFATRPALIGGDEPHYALIAHSLAVDHDVSLDDEYSEVAGGAPWAGRKRAGQELDRHVRTVGRVEIPTHAIGWPLVAAPLVAMQQSLSPGAAPDLLLIGLTLALTGVALVAAWRTWTAPDERAALLAVFFTTPLWFYGRTFFSEPATTAFLVLAVAALVRRRDLAAALLMAAALAAKETALLAVGPIAVAAVIWEKTRTGTRAALLRAGFMAAGIALYAVAFALKSRATTGEWWTAAQPFVIGDPLTGALGLLIDPRHGFAPFAPLLAFGALGWFLRPRDSTDRLLGWTSLAIFAGYFAVTAAWTDWRGGDCYGPRLLLPALPALAVPTLRLWRQGHRAVRLALLGAAVLGFTLQLRAAADPVPAFWSASVGELLFQDVWKSVLAAGLAMLGCWAFVRRAAMPDGEHRNAP